MDIYDRLALGGDKSAELSYREGAFYLRVLEKQTRHAAVYLTHEIPLTHGQMEGLAYTPRNADLLLNLAGLQVRYMGNLLAFIEDNAVLSWGPRHFMADMALKMLRKVGQAPSAKAS